MTDKSQEIPDILAAIIVVLLVFVAGHLIFALIAAIDAANTVTYLSSDLVRIDHTGKANLCLGAFCPVDRSSQNA